MELITFTNFVSRSHFRD